MQPTVPAAGEHSVLDVLALTMAMLSGVIQSPSHSCDEVELIVDSATDFGTGVGLVAGADTDSETSSTLGSILGSGSDKNAFSPLLAVIVVDSLDDPMEDLDDPIEGLDDSMEGLDVPIEVFFFID
jgi:hypothetical protein